MAPGHREGPQDRTEHRRRRRPRRPGIRPGGRGRPRRQRAPRGARAAIDLATGKSRQGVTVESGLTTGSPTTEVPAGKPSTDDLIPHGLEGAQSRVPLDDAQVANAKAIIAEAKRTGVGSVAR